MQIKLLILAADPINNLNLRHEIQALMDAINLGQKSEEIEVVVDLEVRLEELQNLFLKHKPNIIHFCGHGNGERGLVFENREQVDTEALAKLLQLIYEIKPIQCVLLNACYSEIQASIFSEYIDYVIGMRQEIQDKAAISFSIGFYTALGYRLSIEECYKFGCNAIQFLQLNKSSETAQERKLGPTDSSNSAIIPEHLKPILKIKPTSISPQLSSEQSYPQKITIEDQIRQRLKENKIVEDQSAIELRSDVGINYAPLQNLLAAGKWKEADETTKEVMLKAVKREKDGWLDDDSVKNFPCADLNTIDQLWSKYSNGRFGLSIQKQKWLEVGGEVNSEAEKKLGESIGWREGEQWLGEIDKINYSLDAPLGHLPFGVYSITGTFVAICSRVESCKL